ncbi:MAG: hypothetical protein PVI90_00835 [Desulfobacteraceae bacterium]
MQQMNIRFATTMMVEIGGETKNIEVISEGGLIWISINKIKKIFNDIDIPFDPTNLDLLMPMKKRIVRMVMMDGDLDFQIDSESMIRWIEKINEKKEEEKKEKEEKEEEKKGEENSSSTIEWEGEETTE